MTKEEEVKLEAGGVIISTDLLTKTFLMHYEDTISIEAMVSTRLASTILAIPHSMESTTYMPNRDRLIPARPRDTKPQTQIFHHGRTARKVGRLLSTQLARIMTDQMVNLSLHHAPLQVTSESSKH